MCKLSTIPFQNLTGSHLAKKFPALYGNRKFIAAFTRARHLSQINHFHALHPPTWRSILILSCHLRISLPNGSIAYVVPRDESSSEVFVTGSYHGKLLRWRNVSTSPKPQAGETPLVVCPRLLIQYIRSYPLYWRPLLHQQPDDAPQGPTQHGYIFNL